MQEKFISSLLSSYILYKKLYDEKKDVYDVIAEYIKVSIITHAKRQFNSLEMKQLLKDDYNFDIPEAIIKTSLKRLKKDDILKSIRRSEYIVLNSNISHNSIQKKLEEQKYTTSEKINHLFSYIRKYSSNLDEKNVIDALNYYLLDNEKEKNEYSKYIAKFIIENENNQEIKKWLNEIREGVILYSALQYEDIITNKKKLDKNLTIFLDTEILFHAIGYNGELFKEIFFDFYNLIKEINSKRKAIYLKYFQETKDDIENFFKSAEHIVEKNSTPEPQKTAMHSIIDGCKSSSDVIEKKTIFFNEIEKLGIVLYTDDINITEEKYYKYHLVNYEDLEKLKSEFSYSEKEINSIINKLTKVNILKGNNEKNIFKTDFIFLTGNSKYFNIVQYLKVENFLVTHQDFVINKLWLKLHKSFNNGTLPKNFDVITKAKIVLSGMINDNIAIKYANLLDEYKKGNKTEEELALTINGLIETAVKPEDIQQDNIDEVLTVSNLNIDEYVKYQKYYEIKSKKLEKENKQLLEEKNKKDEELKREKLRLEKLKQKAEEKADNAYKKYKRNIILVLFVIILLIAISWNNVKEFFEIIAFIGSIAGYIFLIIYEQTFNPIKGLLGLLDRKKKYFYKKYYSEYEIND